MIDINKCPESLDGAKVISAALPREPVYSLISGQETPIVAYAIAVYGDAEGYYLFALSKSWEVIGDTFWNSLDEAKCQGEYEAGISINDWNDRR